MDKLALLSKWRKTGLPSDFPKPTSPRPFLLLGPSEDVPPLPREGPTLRNPDAHAIPFLPPPRFFSPHPIRGTRESQTLGGGGGLPGNLAGDALRQGGGGGRSRVPPASARGSFYLWPARGLSQVGPSAVLPFLDFP